MDKLTSEEINKGNFRETIQHLHDCATDTGIPLSKSFETHLNTIMKYVQTYKLLLLDNLRQPENDTNNSQQCRERTSN